MNTSFDKAIAGPPRRNPRLHCDGPCEIQQQLEEHDIGAFCGSSTKKPSLTPFTSQDHLHLRSKKTTEISYQMVLRLLAVSWEHASFMNETGTLEVRCDKDESHEPTRPQRCGTPHVDENLFQSICLVRSGSYVCTSHLWTSPRFDPRGTLTRCLIPGISTTDVNSHIGRKYANLQDRSLPDLKHRKR